jgi:hypothetical protein
VIKRAASSVLNIGSKAWRAKRREMQAGIAHAGAYVSVQYVKPEGKSTWHFSFSDGTYNTPQLACRTIRNASFVIYLPRQAPFSMGHLNEIDFWS